MPESACAAVDGEMGEGFICMRGRCPTPATGLNKEKEIARLRMSSMRLDVFSSALLSFSAQGANLI